MRLQLSPLKAHLFRYNLTDNPFCPSCGEEIETTLHYFLTCRTYEIPRRTLLHSLEMLDANMASDTTKLDFVIFGASDSSISEIIRVNKILFRHICIYLTKTNRFGPLNL